MQKEKCESRLNAIKSKYLYLLISKFFLIEKMKKNKMEDLNIRKENQLKLLFTNAKKLYNKMNEIRKSIKGQLINESNILSSKINLIKEFNLTTMLYPNQKNVSKRKSSIENSIHDFQETTANSLIESNLINIKNLNQQYGKLKLTQIVVNMLSINPNGGLDESVYKEMRILKDELVNKNNEIENKKKEIMKIKNENLEKENDLTIKLETETIEFLSKSENYIKKINELNKENDELRKIKVF